MNKNLVTGDKLLVLRGNTMVWGILGSSAQWDPPFAAFRAILKAGSAAWCWNRPQSTPEKDKNSVCSISCMERKTWTAET